MYMISTTMNVVTDVIMVLEIVWLILSVMTCGLSMRALPRFLSDTVEDNDRIIERVSDERKERGNHREVDLEISDQ